MMADKENMVNEAPAAAGDLTAKAASVTETATKSPYEIWKERLVSVQNRTGAFARIPIRGLDDDDDDDDEAMDEDSDEEEQVDPNTYTQAQVDRVQCILVTPERKKALDEMEKLVLGDQYGHTCMMFTTSFSYRIPLIFEILKKKFNNARSWPRKFDMLFAFTFMIRMHDVWMHDHEYGQDLFDMLESLAGLWKNIQRKDENELGIDLEFTKPGYLKFLVDFQKDVQRIEIYDEASGETGGFEDSFLL